MQRYARSLRHAWEYERQRLKHGGRRWYRNRLALKISIPLALCCVFFQAAGARGLAIYILEMIGAAFSVQAITYLQHWGINQRDTPTLEDFGFSWEDGCWMQACVTLNHAFHGQHHLYVRKRYYELSLGRHGLPLPASYPVMFVLALFPAVFDRIMRRHLADWLADYKERGIRENGKTCLGALCFHDINGSASPEKR